MSDVEDNTEAVVDSSLFCSPIANPLMAGKLYGRTLKLMKKAAEAKKIRRGVPEVAKAIRKGQKGVVIIAADIYPVDVVSHLPIYCEEKGILYCYVPSRQALGEACQTKRAASAVMVFEPQAGSVYAKAYEQVSKGVKAINPYM